MYRLQLFDDAHSLQPVDARILHEGILTIGRDPSANWTIADPDCAPDEGCSAPGCVADGCGTCQAANGAPMSCAP